MNLVNKLLQAEKIALFGWPATGKSTFGKFISNKLNIELYSLDIIRWKYSKYGIKDDSKFLEEYEEILKKDRWIIEGNALDFISSRLEQSDALIFFDSSVEKCIENYKNREEKVKSGEEKRLNFDETKSNNDTIEWIKNKYSKKIEKLRITLKDYNGKLIIINNYEELSDLINQINIKLL